MLDNTGTTKFNSFFFPRTEIDEHSSTFYAEFRYANWIVLPRRVPKIQRAVFVQNGVLLANETGRNLPLKCRAVWLSLVFRVRYILLQCPATVCQHTWAPLASLPLFHSLNVLVKSFTCSSLTSLRFFVKNCKWGSKKSIYRLLLHPIALYEGNRSYTTSR